MSDLDAIADYVSLDNPAAARQLVGRVLLHVEQLEAHPQSGPKLPELPGWRYHQIIEPPCRVIYRQDRKAVYILHVVRSERLLDSKLLRSRGRAAKK